MQNAELFSKALPDLFFYAFDRLKIRGELDGG